MLWDNSFSFLCIEFLFCWSIATFAFTVFIFCCADFFFAVIFYLVICLSSLLLEKFLFLSPYRYCAVFSSKSFSFSFHGLFFHLEFMCAHNLTVMLSFYFFIWIINYPSAGHWIIRPFLLICNVTLILGSISSFHTCGSCPSPAYLNLSVAQLIFLFSLSHVFGAFSHMIRCSSTV